MASRCNQIRGTGRAIWMAGVAGMLATSVVTWETMGMAAEDRQACVESYELGQRLKLRAKLTEARQQFLKCALPSCPSAVSADCARFLADIDADLPSVVIGVTDARGNDVTDVLVRVDNVLMVEGLDGRAIELDPGPHVFRFEAPGTIPVEQPIVVRQGERNRMVAVRLELQPSSVPPTASRRAGISTAVFALGGVALAGLVAGGALKGAALLQREHMYETCAPACSEGSVNEVFAKDVAGSISLVVGGLAAAGAVTVWFVQSRKPTQGGAEFRVIPSHSGVFGDFALRF